MKQKLFYFLALSSVLMLSGCLTTRTYSVARERVDQDLTGGNRGYIMGRAPAESATAKKSTREIRVFEIEFGRPYEAKNVSVPVSSQELNIPAASVKTDLKENMGQPESVEPVTASAHFQKYTVGKNDTLQKISKKFYGTSKKWMKIYKANTDILKGPDKVYPGQVLNIPDASEVKSPAHQLAEPRENLK